jgi:NADPH:quinone reductase
LSITHEQESLCTRSAFTPSARPKTCGAPLSFTEEELAERGIISQLVLGPPMLQRVGGDVRVLEDQAMPEAIAGRLRPAVQRFPLADAAGAHHALETRGTVGKVVLIP